MTKILETTVTTSEYFTLQTYGNSGNLLDDIVMLELDGDTWETETYAYPPTADLRYAANELISRCRRFAVGEKDGATHTYTYDQFGRLTKKTDGTYTADFYYHYGDTLIKEATKSYDDREEWSKQAFTNLGCGPATDQKRRSRAVSGGDTVGRVQGTFCRSGSGSRVFVGDPSIEPVFAGLSTGRLHVPVGQRRASVSQHGWGC